MIEDRLGFYNGPFNFGPRRRRAPEALITGKKTKKNEFLSKREIPNFKNLS